MAFLTIFSAPKPFTNPHINVIQRNAIGSWTHLGPEVEVFLIGEEPGMAQAAEAYGVPCLTEVARNELGTPLVSSIFALARRASQSPLMAYVNADILLLPDFVAAAKNVSRQCDHFLIIGQRWDLEVLEGLAYSEGWDEQLREDARKRAQLHLPAGSDYFIFPRELFAEMPDFAVGRAGWDNWMIYHARRQKWPVIDGTPSILAIHQDHDYSHLPGGKPHYELPESQKNTDLAGGSANLFMVLDSDKELRDGQLRTPRLTRMRLVRHIEVALTPPGGERRGSRWAAARLFRRMRRRMTGSL